MEDTLSSHHLETVRNLFKCRNLDKKRRKDCSASISCGEAYYRWFLLLKIPIAVIAMLHIFIELEEEDLALHPL